MLGYLYILAISVEAMSGAISAGRKRMDPFGILVVATFAAFGGGTLRDLVLGNYPLVWVGNPKYLIVTTVAVLSVILLRPWIRHLTATFLVLDAIGLVTFSVIGAQKTLALGHGYLIASIMAVLTGAFGGVLRDLMCNQIPLVFKREVYGSVSFLTAWIFILLEMTSLSVTVTVPLTLAIGFSLRILAIVFKINLPVIPFRQKPNE